MKWQRKTKGKMRQRELFTDERSLFEKLCDQRNLRSGFKAVKKNGGSPGIDGVTIEEFGNRLEEELVQLQKELESWNYKPKPVRRVEIPKPGKGWALSLTFALAKAYSVRWFIQETGQVIRSNEKHPHWFSLRQWIQTT